MANIQCEHCQSEMEPSKKGVKRFCGKECRATAWYAANKAVTIQRAADWRAKNPEKMTECRLKWVKKNPTYHSEYTFSWRGEGENVRMAVEAIQEASDLSPEDRVELAHQILDLKLGYSTPNVVEAFLVEVFDE